MLYWNTVHCKIWASKPIFFRNPNLVKGELEFAPLCNELQTRGLLLKILQGKVITVHKPLQHALDMKPLLITNHPKIEEFSFLVHKLSVIHHNMSHSEKWGKK